MAPALPRDPVRVCEARTCVALGLPPHSHVLVPFPPELVTHRWSATHREGPDIDRIQVDWRAVAYHLWTGRDLPPPPGQLTLSIHTQETPDG